MPDFSVSAVSVRKEFSLIEKEPGLTAAIKGLFYRRKITRVALDQVDINVAPGEIVGLIGANGAGKTTLVKILAGIVFPTSGEVKVLGFTPWERHKEFRRSIALVVGQKAQLWWDLPADDCFLLIREIYQIPKEKFKATRAELVELLQVGNLLKTPVRRLSLGERMKMEIIAALLHQPKVIFLDEPTIGLDFATQVTLRDFLRRYREEYKPAIILTSHYMEDIKALANRLVVIRSGRVVFEGTPEALTSMVTPMRKVTLVTEQELSPQLLATLPHAGTDKSSAYSVTTTIPVTATQQLLSEALACQEISDIRVEEEDISVLITRMMHELQ